MTEKLTTQDFELEPPSSLRNFIEDQMRDSVDYDLKRGKKVEPITDEVIDDLMPRVYAWIEKQALEVYKTNEPWALKAWAFSNILKDTVSSEVTQTMAEELMSPVAEWQNKQPFNPIGYYRERLDTERKSDQTKRCYLAAAARFVAKMGRKRNYTDGDIEEYQKLVNKRYPHQGSYYQELRLLLQFLRRLPGADKQRQLPMGMPKMPTEFYQPTFSNEEVEALIWATVLDNIPGSMVVRLLVASVYGARRSELTELRGEDINLDGDESTIFIRTKKGGQRKPQPIPKSLVPLFAVPIGHMNGHTVQRKLKTICRKAGVHLPFRGGYHCFRRRTVTEVAEVNPSDVDVSNFMRWAKPRTMLARYKQTPVEQTDRAILERHPFVKMWEEVAPYLLSYNSTYEKQGLLYYNKHYMV
ncbi:hypothetical protein ES703_10148 [subsurface metagenome]